MFGSPFAFPTPSSFDKYNLSPENPSKSYSQPLTGLFPTLSNCFPVRLDFDKLVEDNHYENVLHQDSPTRQKSPNCKDFPILSDPLSQEYIRAILEEITELFTDRPTLSSQLQALELCLHFVKNSPQ
jgi:hypothetical protein